MTIGLIALNLYKTLKPKNMKNKFTLLFLIFGMLTLFFACQKDDTHSDNQYVKKLIPELKATIFRNNSVIKTNDKLNNAIQKFSKRTKSQILERTIYSEVYDFSIDTSTVQQIETASYVSYTFFVERETSSTTILENYVYTIFENDSISQMLIAYPILESNGNISYDIPNASINFILDDVLIYQRGCVSLMEFENPVCTYISCSSGHHSLNSSGWETCEYWTSSGGFPPSLPSCTEGGWVDTGCTNTGGPGGPGPGGSTGGGSHNNGNNPPVVVVVIALPEPTPVWQPILNCINGINLNGSTDNTTIDPDILASLNLTMAQTTQMINYLNSSGCSEQAQADVLMDILELVEAKLNEELEINSFKLLEIDCNQIQYWQTLAQHTAPNSVQAKIDNLPSSFFNNFEIQSLEDANGPIINMDYFPVNITTLPNNPNTGQQFTASQFLNYFRRNINSFVAGGGTTFEPYCEIPSMCQTETDLWNSNNPLGAIIYLDIPTDDGVVVCTKYQSDYWYFMTMNAPFAGNHPVSGTRQFGYKQNLNGSYDFFVRGVDRMNSLILASLAQAFTNADPYLGADLLWYAFQTNMNNFVNQHGGNSTIGNDSKNRPNWNKVKDVLSGNSPISDLGCD